LEEKLLCSDKNINNILKSNNIQYIDINAKIGSINNNLIVENVKNKY